jgi:hypothetical protein
MSVVALSEAIWKRGGILREWAFGALLIQKK